MTQSVYLIFQILFTQDVGKHQFVHYPGLTGVESCSKDHKPQDRIPLASLDIFYKTTQAAFS